MPQYLDDNGNPIAAPAKQYLDDDGNPIGVDTTTSTDTDTKGLAPKIPEARTFANYASEAARGVGRGIKNDVMGLAALRHPIDSAETAMSQANESGVAAGQEWRDTAGQPLGRRLGATALAGLEKAPLIGGMVEHAEQGGERMASPEAVGAAAEGITSFEAPHLVAPALRLAKRVGGAAVDAAAGTGPRVARKVATEAQEANAAAAEARPEQVKKFFEKTQAARKAADRRSSIASRKAALDSGVRTLSDKFQVDLKALRDTQHALADAKYRTLNEVLGESPADVETIGSAVGDAKAKIQGSQVEPKIFKDILNRLDAENQAPGGSLQYKDLQGYYSELGAELSKGTLPGDLYTAYSTLQDAIGTEMQRIADGQGQGAKLTDARSSWRSLKETFYDPASPLKKALDAKEPGGAIRSLAGKDRTGIEALAKYDPKLAQRANIIRGYAEEARGLRPSKDPVKPAPSLAPREAPKTVGTADIEMAKGKSLEKRASQIRHAGTYAAVWPMFYVIKQAIAGHAPNLFAAGAESAGTALAGNAIASILENPKVAKFLTKATARDIAEIPPDLRGSLPQIVKTAKGRGIRVSQALTDAAQGAIFLAPRNPTDDWASPQQ